MAAPLRPSGTLRVFAYEDSFPDAYIGPFLKRYPELRFEHISYDTDGEAMERLEGGVEAEVLAACVEETLAWLVARRHLQPLDTARLACWDRLAPAFRGLPGITVEGQTWMAPVDSAPTGLMFDTTNPRHPRSFSDLLTADLGGAVALDAKPVIALHIAALAIGIADPPGMNRADLDRVAAFLLDLKARSRFPILWRTGDDLLRLFGSHSIVASSGFPGDTRDLQRRGLPVAFAVAEESPVLFACGFGLAASCANFEGAYAFLNFVLEADSQAEMARSMDFMVSNIDAASSVALNPDNPIGGLPRLLEAGPPPRPPERPEAWAEIWARVLQA